MNIGFFTDTYSPSVDGVVVSINLFKRELERLGHTVYVFAPAGLKFKEKIKDEKNIFRFKSLDSVFVPGYSVNIPISFKAVQHLPKLKLDVIHCHTPLMLGMFGDIVATLQNLPLVYTYHTFYPEYAKHYIFKKKNIAPKLIEKFDTFYCNRCDQVIAPSKKLEKILLNYGIKSPIAVLPTGVDLSLFKNVDSKIFRKKYNIADDKKVLIYVGRLSSEKNVEFLIKTMGELAHKNPDILLVLIGKGKDEDNLKKLVGDLGLKDQVIFTGILPSCKVREAYAGSDIFIFSSKTDTQGLVLQEAAASGLPIVMIKDNGLTDAVHDGENGFEVNEDIYDFSNNILKLLQDKNLYDKMSANSERIVKNLSLEDQTKKLLDLYEKVIQRYRSSSFRIKFWKNLIKEIEVPSWIKMNSKKIKDAVKKSGNFLRYKS